MRVSEYYGLNRTQPTLDFVDVDVEGDASVFIDPRALRILPSTWGSECVSLIQNFFRSVLRAIQDKDQDLGHYLLRALREPNETHLGLSIGRARGRAIGYHSAGDVWEALSKSEAAKSGLLEELEDTVLMIEGIASDIISDITTNIIRKPLIQYTQDMANYYGIPLVPDVDSGLLWNASEARWYSDFVSLPVTKEGKLLLVPKIIVRRKMEYDVDEYYRYFLLEHLREAEFSANTALVQLLKNGSRRVTNKDLRKKYGSGKAMIVRETQNYPEVLEKYRGVKRNYHRPPLDHTDISESEGTPKPEWDELLRSVVEIPTGHEYFSQYEGAIESLLSALFYPSLTNPVVQLEIHGGRKRIDITYTNTAIIGFFFWLGMHYSAPHVFIECKNYGRELGNPELDQMAGRFSPSRGQFGIIVCRNFENKELFLKRCKDTATDNRGFIMPIDDNDLKELIDELKANPHETTFDFLRSRFETLVL